MPQNKDFTRRIEILDECLRRRQKKWFIEDLFDAVNKKLDDRFERLKLIINNVLRSVLLSYTPDIEVLQPISLGNQLMEKYLGVVELHK